MDHEANMGKILLEIERLKEKFEERKEELPITIITDVLGLVKSRENMIESYKIDIERFEKFKSESKNEEMESFFDNLIQVRKELLAKTKPIVQKEQKEMICALLEKNFYVDYCILKIMENKIELYRKLRKKYIAWSKISKNDYKDKIFECDCEIDKKKRDRDSFVASCKSLKGLYFYEKFFEK